MNLERQLSKVSVIADIDHLKEQVDQRRPIPKEVQDRIFQKFRLDWNYHSNAIEGNPYTYGETVTFLLHGITAKGKKLKDHLDIKGHNDGISFLLGMIKEERPLNETDIRSLHKIILVQEYEVDAITAEGEKTKKQIQIGRYKTAPNHVKKATGYIHHYASPEETPALMTDLLDWYTTTSQDPEVHPLVLATLFHHKFVAIHPFDDGNGRLGRILMNLTLMRHQYPPIVIKQEDRNNYYSVLSQADTGDYLPIMEYMGNLLLESLQIQYDGIMGKDISEPADIDKQIALFKASLTDKDALKEKRSPEKVKVLLSGTLYELLSSLQMRYKSLDELFHESAQKIEVTIDSSDRRLIKELPNRFTSSWLKSLDLDQEPIVFLQYWYHWKGFKKSDRPFDVQSYIQIKFDDYKYGIAYAKQGPQSAISKFYHQTLSSEDKQQAIEGVIKRVLEDIRIKVST